ncbi:LOW QUALITY PROTEIN: uncharacterized protein WCC33_009043 [Rhinophrynus dorsalis]
MSSSLQGNITYIRIIVKNITMQEGGEWDGAIISAQTDIEKDCDLNSGEGGVLTVDELNLVVRKRERCQEQRNIPWPEKGIVVVPTHDTMVQGVGWTYYPILVDFNYFSIPLRCPEQQKAWFNERTQEIIDEWAGAGRRPKRDTIATILGGVGTGLGVWNSADIMGLNSRINSLTDGMGHAMKTGGVADTLILNKLGDNIDDVHSIAHNLQLVEESILAITRSIRSEAVGTAIFCSMTGEKLLSDLREIIRDIKGNKWTERLNATRIIATLEKRGVLVTKENLHYAYIEGPGEWLPWKAEPKTVGLMLAIPRWEGQAEPLNFVHSIGTPSQGIYQQHFPSKRLSTSTGVVVDEGCCRKSQHWLCACAWEKGDMGEGWVQLTKVGLVREVIRLGDVACFIGHHEYRTSDETCKVEEGSCIQVTRAIHVGTHTLFPSGNLTMERLNFTGDIKKENWTMELFPPIPPLTLELQQLVHRTKQQLQPISHLIDQQKQEVEKTMREVSQPWWSILTNVETHPVMRTLSIVLMFIQLVTTGTVLYFCVRMKRMKNLWTRDWKDF